MFLRGQLHAYERHPSVAFLFVLLLSCWMKRSKHIPFPTSELGEWSGSLLYVGRERADQNCNTSLWCCWYTSKAESWKGCTDHPSIVLRPRSQPLDTHLKSLCVCVWLITQHCNVLDSRELQAEFAYDYPSVVADEDLNIWTVWVNWFDEMKRRTEHMQIGLNFTVFSCETEIV